MSHVDAMMMVVSAGRSKEKPLIEETIRIPFSRHSWGLCRLRMIVSAPTRNNRYIPRYGKMA